MATYSHTTYLQFRQLVAKRLSDPNNIFWTDTELKRYCLEILRTWNSIAWYSRDRGLFQTVANQAFYDIPSNLLGSQSVPQVDLLSYNLKDQDLYTDIKYTLLEDASTSNTWTGTDQFDQASIQDAMQETRNQFLFETGLIATHSTINASPPIDSIYGLPDNVAHIRRVAFQSNIANSPFIPLQNQDEYGATSYSSQWLTNPGTPIAYSTIMNPKVSLQLIPFNELVGTLDIVSVNTPTDLNLSSGVLLNIPDDLAWIIKYGTLATLLSGEGQRNDKQRADYCTQRYKQGVMLAKLWNTIQQVMINGVPLIPSTIYSADTYTPLWQTSTGSGQPTDILVVAPNLIALRPIPDSTIYSILMDVVRNFPIPSLDGDFIQVGREELDTLVNATAHLASFKQGSQEFFDTVPLFQDMLDMAGYYNRTLMALAPNIFNITKQSTRGTKDKPISTEKAA